MVTKLEAVTPAAVMSALLDAAGDRAVLVGGQALGFWMAFYGLAVPEGIPAISNDSDFLARSAADTRLVSRLAKVIGGQVIIAHERALTAIVGQAVLDLSEEEVINVDVLHRIIGLDAKAVRARAVSIAAQGVSFLVMHPLDVLRSRLANLHELREKQNDKGELQLRMAIAVAREHVLEQARAASPEAARSGRSAIQPLVSEIERMALEDAGRKVARRHGIHVADAIDPSSIPAGLFWERKWPQLRKLMSAEHASRFRPPAPLKG